MFLPVIGVSNTLSMSAMTIYQRLTEEDNVQRRWPHRLYRLGANMRRIHFACSVLIPLSLFFGGLRLCAGSAQESLLVRDGKKLICTVLFQDSLDVDCGTQSYTAVFTAKILAVSQLHGGGPRAADALGAVPASDLRLTVEPEEVFKGRPSRQ